MTGNHSNDKAMCVNCHQTVLGNIQMIYRLISYFYIISYDSYCDIQGRIQDLEKEGAQVARGRVFRHI